MQRSSALVSDGRIQREDLRIKPVRDFRLENVCEQLARQQQRRIRRVQLTQIVHRHNLPSTKQTASNPTSKLTAAAAVGRFSKSGSFL